MQGNFLEGYVPRFLAAFPPCTDLAVCGAKHFADKKAKNPAVQFHAMQVIWQCHVIAELFGVPYFIEQPTSQAATYWRKPDHYFNPCDYTKWCKDDNYTKKTSLWTGGGFIMPPENKLAGLPEPDDRIHKATPSPTRADERSETPLGFARAVYHSNFGNLPAGSIV